eukprot:34732_1
MAAPKMKGKGIDCIIDDCLYLGDAKISRDLHILKTVGITHIVCIAGKAVFENEFTYHLCHFKDKQDSDMLQLMPPIFAFIDDVIGKGKNKIYVHCMAGMSRSPSIVMAYLMYKFQLTIKHAYIYVINKRSCIRPNYVFLQQLLKYENILFGDDFKNSIDSKDLRNISSLYKKKWRKELQKKQFDFAMINVNAIIKLENKQNNQENMIQNEENKDD